MHVSPWIALYPKAVQCTGRSTLLDTRAHGNVTNNALSSWRSNVGPTGHSENHQVIQEVYQQLDPPLALEKVEGPSTSLTFLGILLDGDLSSSRKITAHQTWVAAWLGIRNAKKRQILSLVGLLEHTTEVVKPGQTFVARMYKAGAKLKKLHHKTRLTKGFQSDLQWWHIFVTTWNGVNFITETPYRSQFAAFKPIPRATGAVEHTSTHYGYSMLGHLNGLTSQ